MLANSEIMALMAIFVAYLMSAVTPGPNLAYIIGVASKYGRKGALVAGGTAVFTVFLRFTLTALLFNFFVSVTPQIEAYLPIIASILFAFMAIRSFTTKKESQSFVQQKNGGGILSIIFYSVCTNIVNANSILFCLGSVTILQATKNPSPNLVAFAILGVTLLSAIWNLSQAILYSSPKFLTVFMKHRAKVTIALGIVYGLFSVRAALSI